MRNAYHYCRMSNFISLTKGDEKCPLRIVYKWFAGYRQKTLLTTTLAIYTPDPEIYSFIVVKICTKMVQNWIFASLLNRYITTGSKTESFSFLRNFPHCACLEQRERESRFDWLFASWSNFWIVAGAFSKALFTWRWMAGDPPIIKFTRRRQEWELLTKEETTK